MAVDQPNKMTQPINTEIVRQMHLDDIAQSVGYFVEHPYRQLGDTDSGHGVLFGTLPPYGEVGIKPFLTIGQAEHEKKILEHVMEQGFDAIEPLDIAAQGVYVYLISEYRPKLRHLGQVNWNENVASRRLKRVITPTVNFAAELAGDLHSRGITHGDMQAKNVLLATDGTPVLGDLENGQMHLSGTELARKGDRDMTRFGWSVLSRGLLADRSMRYRLSYLGDELVDPALDAEGLSVDYDRRKAVLENIEDALITDFQRKNPGTRTGRKKAA